MTNDTFMANAEHLVPASLADDGSSLTTLCMLFSCQQGQDESAIKTLKKRSLDVSAALLTSAGRTKISDGITAALYFAAQEHSNEYWGRPIDDVFTTLAHSFEALDLTKEQHEHAYGAYLQSRLVDDMEYLPDDLFMANLNYVNPFSGLVPAWLANDGSKLTALCMLYPDKSGHSHSSEAFKKRSLDVSAALLTNAGRTKIVDGETAAFYFAAKEYCNAAGQSVWGMFPAIARDFVDLGLTNEHRTYANDAYLDSCFMNMVQK